MGGRTETPTNRVRPGPQATALADENARLRILLDDGSSLQNPSPIPSLGADGLGRAGDADTLNAKVGAGTCAPIALPLQGTGADATRTAIIDRPASSARRARTTATPTRSSTGTRHAVRPAWRPGAPGAGAQIESPAMKPVLRHTLTTPSLWLAGRGLLASMARRRQQRRPPAHTA